MIVTCLLTSVRNVCLFFTKEIFPIVIKIQMIT